MRRSRLRAVDGDWHETYRLRFATIHGYRRAYVCAGEGPALLLIHGIGDSSATWDALVPTLAEHFTVVVPDLLGHGASDAPRADYTIAAYASGMRDLLAFLDIDRATVIGHSLGGGIAMQFAYQFPQMCDRLVLVSSGGAGTDVHPALRVAAVPGVERVLPLLTTPLARLAGRAATRVLDTLGVQRFVDAGELVRTLESLPDQASRSAFCRTLRSVVDGRGQFVTMMDRAYLAADIPTMLVWGAQDRVIPIEHGYAVAVAMPAARMEVFANAAHFPHHADPARFLTAVADFCAATEPAAHDESAWRGRLREGAPTCAAVSVLADALEPPPEDENAADDAADGRVVQGPNAPRRRSSAAASTAGLLQNAHRTSGRPASTSS
ncbi:MAG: alpha/beta hydrolase fold [Frankiales bacterium]|jgi:pimeloyl-ACP methyl ester carboxylesterase|nr:alpha/beta hydrolase fold [Frankiales bacterium]